MHAGDAARLRAFSAERPRCFRSSYNKSLESIYLLMQEKER